MKAIPLVKYGKAETAFEIREYPLPIPKSHEVLVKVDAFGLNFADVMARHNMYRDAPPLPGILGYEAVGIIEEVGSDVADLHSGQRIIAFTRFGAYAEYVTTDQRAVAPIPDNMANGVAAALATQYCTAWHAACEMINLFEDEKVLIHAAAGGVGTALVQIAKMKGCEVFGTTSSQEKIEYLKTIGVDHPINYQEQDFVQHIENIIGNDRLDVVFDSVGGSVFKRSKKLLGPGGRIVAYGAAERMKDRKGILSTIGLAWRFGLLHPIPLLLNSQSVTGVYMLKIADHKPHIMKRCLSKVVELTTNGQLSPKVGGVGLNLVAANHVIHVERWWNPAIENQCNDRAFRIGQEKPVTVYLPLAIHPGSGEQSFDVNLHNLLERKNQLGLDLLVPTDWGREDTLDLFRRLTDDSEGAPTDALDDLTPLEFEKWICRRINQTGFTANLTPGSATSGTAM